MDLSHDRVSRIYNLSLSMDYTCFRIFSKILGFTGPKISESSPEPCNRILNRTSGEETGPIVFRNLNWISEPRRLCLIIHLLLHWLQAGPTPRACQEKRITDYEKTMITQSAAYF